jgi:hypothetical protein
MPDSRFPHLPRAAALAVALAGLTATATFAVAGGGARPATPALSDARVLCPALDKTLSDRLARTLHLVGDARVVDVRFTVVGSEVRAETPLVADASFQRALRRAVEGLDCKAQGAQPQHARLTLVFVDSLDDDAAAAVRLAATRRQMQ